MALAIWLFLFLLMLLALGGLWGPLLDRKGVRFVLAPGFLALLAWKHLGCLLAVAKVRESKPFGPGDEVAVHGEPKVPGIGNLLAAGLPFFGMLVTFAGVHEWMGRPLAVPRSLPALPASPAAVGPFIDGIAEYVKGAIGVATALPRAHWMAWIAAWLALSTLLALRPPFRDLKYVSLTILLVAGIAWLCDYAGIGRVRATEGSLKIDDWTTLTTRNLGLLIALTLLCLLASAVTIGFVRLWEWIKEGRQREKARQQAEKAHQKNG